MSVQLIPNNLPEHGEGSDILSYSSGRKFGRQRSSVVVPRLSEEHFHRLIVQHAEQFVVVQYDVISAAWRQGFISGENCISFLAVR